VRDKVREITRTHDLRFILGLRLGFGIGFGFGLKQIKLIIAKKAYFDLFLFTCTVSDLTKGPGVTLLACVSRLFSEIWSFAVTGSLSTAYNLRLFCT